MARPLRIQFSGAIYHVMARGNGRQQLFHEARDYERLTEGLEKTVDRTGWEVFAYVWMPNHIHLFFRTPRPNLSQGMQYLLSGYANWYAKRHQRTGHLFQGRFKGELVEDDRYFWTVSRYLHLNPVRGKQPLVTHPRDWPWSSYVGYSDKRKQIAFVQYQAVWDAWQAEYGGRDPVSSYRRFVEAGLSEPPKSPFADAWDGWIVGGKSFVEKIKKAINQPKNSDQVKQLQRLTSLEPQDVIQMVADHFEVDPESYRQRRSNSPGRDVAAYLAHRLTTATLRELVASFGLSHPDSVSNLIRRTEKQLQKSPSERKLVSQLKAKLTQP